MGKDFAFRHSYEAAYDRHNIDFDNDEIEGSAQLREKRKGKSLDVIYVGAGKKGQDHEPNVLKPTHVRKLLNYVKGEFPKAEVVQGKRISGARWSGMSDDEYEEAGGHTGIYASTRIRK